MKVLAHLNKWHHTRAGYLIFGLAELLAALALASRAFETGSLWQYFFGLVLLVGFLQNLAKLIRTFLGKPRRSTKA